MVGKATGKNFAVGVFFVSGNVQMSHVLYGDGLTGVSLEDVLGQMTDALSGNNWDPRQNADLVVIGQTNDDRYYILNEPSEEAMELLAKEYAGNRPKIRDVNRMRLCRVTVRNMKYSGFDSTLLEATVGMAQSEHGYCVLFPIDVRIAQSELYTVMRTMMKLKMLKLNRSKKVERLLHKYERMLDKCAGC